MTESTNANTRLTAETINAMSFEKLCTYRSDPKLSSWITAVVNDLHDGELQHIIQLFQSETSHEHLIAMFKLLILTNVNSVEFMWCSSFYEPSKSLALSAINELRGIACGIGSGIECVKCRKMTAIIVPVQTRSGDEATGMKIICNDPICKHIQFIGS